MAADHAEIGAAEYADYADGISGPRSTRITAAEYADHAEIGAAEHADYADGR